MTPTLPIFTVDAFTDRPFAGNPAAVIPLESWLPDATLQAIAAELNLSETAFLVPEGEGWHLRWFTPTIEVDLCGHATLASAHALWAELGRAEPELRFRSRGGDLVVRRDGERLELDFPSHPPGDPDAVTDVAALLGVEPEEVLLARIAERGRILMVRLAAEATVRALAPRCQDFAAAGVHDLMATAPGDDVDFVSRYFAPGSGIPEDPVTGSAHCTLAPYWGARLGKEALRARQVSPRGGDLWCRLAGDRVRIAGHAVTVLRGSLALPG